VRENAPSPPLVRLEGVVLGPVTLTRAQADRLAARAISEGKNLDALVAEILESAPTQPSA
jgi:hypothetical protein